MKTIEFEYGGLAGSRELFNYKSHSTVRTPLCDDGLCAVRRALCVPNSAEAALPPETNTSIQLIQYIRRTASLLYV